MGGEIDAVYIYDEFNHPLIEHVYRSRPPSAAAILPLLLAHPTPRPPLLHFPDLSPPVTVFSVIESNLLFLALSEVDTEPLLVLEFLHRVVDALEDFVGAPLLSSKIQANYDVAAQLLHEMCDGGIVCNTEPNALQEVVETPGWMGKLLSGAGLTSSSSPSRGAPKPLKPLMSSSTANQGPAIPWRKAGVRHTSNEMYVDIIETLEVTIAPSGRLLSAFALGTIAFTSKLSGVPDLLLSLAAPGGQHTIARKIDLPVFHPCVRLARWKEKPGELSFIPPDGQFILAGYEVDLLSIDPDLDEPPRHMEKIFLPAIVDIRKSLGPTGADFEVRLTLNNDFPGHKLAPRPGAGRSGSGTGTPSFFGSAGGGTGINSSSPVLDEVVVTVPISKAVRIVTDMKASRGDAHISPGSEALEWRVPTKDAGTLPGTATLRCTVAGHEVLDDDLNDTTEEPDPNVSLLQGYYDPSSPYQGSGINTKPKKKKKKTKKSKHLTASPADTDRTDLSPSYLHSQQQTSTPPPHPSPSPSRSTSRSIFHQPTRKTKAQLNAMLMPNSASVSFSVEGWLPSGIKVESVNIDPRRSRGLGEGVKPYKGVKYLCVSRRGVERRC